MHERFVALLSEGDELLPPRVALLGHVHALQALQSVIRKLLLLQPSFVSQLDVLLKIFVGRSLEAQIISTEKTAQVQIIGLIRSQGQHFEEGIGLAVGQGDAGQWHQQESHAEQAKCGL